MFRHSGTKCCCFLIKKCQTVSNSLLNEWISTPSEEMLDYVLELPTAGHENQVKPTFSTWCCLQVILNLKSTVCPPFIKIVKYTSKLINNFKIGKFIVWLLLLLWISVTFCYLFLNSTRVKRDLYKHDDITPADRACTWWLHERQVLPFSLSYRLLRTAAAQCVIHLQPRAVRCRLSSYGFDSLWIYLALLSYVIQATTQHPCGIVSNLCRLGV